MAEELILVCDDTAASRYMVRRALEAAGYATREATTGAEALLAAQREPPDLITLDVRLPDISGLEVCRQLKANPATAAIPVLHVSATYTSAEAQAEGLKVAEAYLTEPVDPRVLVATVQALLRARRAEAERNQLIAELRQRDLEREKLIHELRDANELRERLLGVVSHDLRDPLSAISMAARLFARTPNLGEAEQKFVRRVTRSAVRMARLITQLLDFVRVRQGGGIALELELVDIHEVCHGVVEEAQVLASDRPITVETHGDGRSVLDPMRISQTLANLVGNAVQHGTGAVHVSSSTSDSEVLVIVQNEGPAIPLELQPVIFDPYRRARDRAQASTRGGVGLGLFIARESVKAHGGEISIVSPDAKEQTSFIVRLPRRRALDA